MSINISELIWTVICFFVLLVVLKKLLFDPLVSFMAARDARIQDGLNAGRTAQQQLDAAARARSEAQRKQAAAADALLAEAKSAAERARRRCRARTRRPRRPRAPCGRVCATKRPLRPPPWTRNCPSSSRR